MNGLYKAELVYRRGPWRGREDLELATLEWVDWFNNRRLFGALGYVPPAEYEASWNPAPLPGRCRDSMIRVSIKPGAIQFLAILLVLSGLLLSHTDGLAVSDRLANAPLEAEFSPAEIEAVLGATGTYSIHQPDSRTELASPVDYDPATDPLLKGVAESFSSDPIAIFNYVYTDIAFEPVVGLKRLPSATLLEGVGTEVDQDALLVSLLRLSGFSATYRYGSETMPLDLAASWLRVDPADTDRETCLRVLTLLNTGNIPHGNCSTAADGSTTVTTSRVWVAAIINGVTIDLDPSLKRNIKEPGLDLAQATGYQRSQFLNDVTEGATVTDSDVMNINDANIRRDLAVVATKLQDSVGENAFLDDVLGGWKLDVQPVTEVGGQIKGVQIVDSSVHDFQSLLSGQGARFRYELTYQVKDSQGNVVLDWQSPLDLMVGSRTTLEFTNGVGEYQI